MYYHGSVWWWYECILSDNVSLHFQSVAIRLNLRGEMLRYLQAWKILLYCPPTGKPSIISLQWLIPHLEMLSKFGQSLALQCFHPATAVGNNSVFSLQSSSPVRSVHWFSPRAAYLPAIIVLWRSASLPAPEIGMHQKPAWSHQHQRPASTSTRNWSAAKHCFQS